jgi:hypothetical protein
MVRNNPMKHEEIPLRVLICDPEKASSRNLITMLSQKDIVVKNAIDHAETIRESWILLEHNNYNCIFVDPLVFGLDMGSQFIFEVRSKFPEIVFVLYVDQAKVERNRAEFYRDRRKRFSHYYSLDKRTSLELFSDELDAILRDCQWWLFRSVSQEKLSNLIYDAKRTREASNEVDRAQISKEIQEVLSANENEKSYRAKQDIPSKSVFISCRFAEDDYVNGLCRLLEQNGFRIITGKATNTYISKAILNRIKECEFFLCLMTRYEEKKDGAFTTSSWLLEEKGAALAYGKRIVIMVEEGVADIGGLHGDWQRINFNPRSFLTASLEAVDQLKSYLGEK